MESLKGIFPTAQPQHKRDFLKENVLKIKKIQRIRKSNDSEYSTKFNRMQQKLSLSNAPQNNALRTTKASINNSGTSSINLDCLILSL